MKPGLRGYRGAARIVVLVCAAALLSGGIGLAYYIDRTYENQRIGEVSAQARILAATVTAALDFRDSTTAEEYVQALRANPEIAAAAVFDSAGKRFAAYPAKPPASLPTAIHGDVPEQQDSMTNVLAPVTEGDRRLGTVLLQTPAEPLLVRLQRYGPIGVLMGMAALLVTMFGMGQAELRRANSALAEHARELAAANHDLQEQITHRQQAEAALRQAQKMEAVGQLTGGIAHDFNNLLQIVLGSLERLRMRGMRAQMPLHPDLDRMIDAAMQGAQRAATLTQRLLAFSRRQPLAPKPLDLNELVSGMSDLLRRSLGESIRIETVLADGLWLTLVDENQLENAVLNLAVNARDAMPRGGTLHIATANAGLDESFGPEEEVKPGDYVLLRVTDTGTGMSPEVLAKAFEPFFTTKDIGQGTGLGLSQVYGFIKQSGGQVKIESRLGEGTAVSLYLPRLLTGSRAAAADRSGPSLPKSAGHECILVVEDEDGVRELTVEMLHELGYKVLQATDSISAIAALKKEPSVGLLFTDIGLPGKMNGRQLAEAARKIRPGLKVLLTSGYAQDAVTSDPKGLGFELIGKPFSAEVLASRIRQVLDATDTTRVTC